MTNAILDSLNLLVQKRRKLKSLYADSVNWRHFSLQSWKRKKYRFRMQTQIHHIELPTSALKLLMNILGELAAGKAVQVVPVHTGLTMQEAANI